MESLVITNLQLAREYYFNFLFLFLYKRQYYMFFNIWKLISKINSGNVKCYAIN
jgi:hypothetical protein